MQYKPKDSCPKKLMRLNRPSLNTECLAKLCSKMTNAKKMPKTSFSNTTMKGD
jgi:hypothetical protein